jgi:uncharacterized protein YccT (UPF0319 family)
MKLRYIVLVLMGSLLSTQALADIHLTTPPQLKLEVVNGEKFNNQKPLVLKNGENQIAFYYEDRLRSGGEDIFLTSDIMLITFRGNNQDFSITVPTFSSEKEFDRFNDKPALTLTDSNGKSVPFEQGKLLKNGIQFNRDLVAEMAAYNQTSAPASLEQPASSIIPSGSQSEGEVAGQMLDYWYSKADEKTREQFKARINK